MGGDFPSLPYLGAGEERLEIVNWRRQIMQPLYEVG